jgi:hypothetical protein
VKEDPRVQAAERAFERRHAQSVQDDLSRQVRNVVLLFLRVVAGFFSVFVLSSVCSWRTAHVFNLFAVLSLHRVVRHSCTVLTFARAGYRVQVPCLPDDDFSVVYTGGIAGLAK